jgi:hypothetical protein
VTEWDNYYRQGYERTLAGLRHVGTTASAAMVVDMRTEDREDGAPAEASPS